MTDGRVESQMSMFPPGAKKGIFSLLPLPGTLQLTLFFDYRPILVAVGTTKIAIMMGFRLGTFVSIISLLLVPVVHGQNEPAIVKKAIQAAGAKGDTSSLYKVAKAWLADPKQESDGWKLVDYLAKEKEHVPSMAQLGHKYGAEGPEQDNAMALHYFKQAGGNLHHASLYNAGLLLAKQSDYVGALAYLRGGTTLVATHPKYAQESMTKLSYEAYTFVSEQAAHAEMTVKESADVFLYGSLDDAPEELEQLWTDAAVALVKFNSTFVASMGMLQDAVSMANAVTAMRQIWEKYSTSLSNLQAFLVLDHMNDMLGPLAGIDDAYVPMAAGYAEALASSPYCYMKAAVTEVDSACFNGAAASAMSYYRRMEETPSTHASQERILEMGRTHPIAATKWDSTAQTPRVYHPALSSKPWWDPLDFSIAQNLMKMHVKEKAAVVKELEALQQLQEGLLRSVMEIDSNGEPLPTMPDRSGLQRIFTPYIGLRFDDEKTATEGAGGWSEFGPLFDGNNWNKENCDVVPTICKALQEDVSSLCTSRKSASSKEKNVWELCGADTVVTILRLRPGTTILPHCGTTNSRLIMHFALQGVDGVEFTVGRETRHNYVGGDGHAIVFDDSFEHSVYHGGKEDRFVVLAVLRHPELD